MCHVNFHNVHSGSFSAELTTFDDHSTGFLDQTITTAVGPTPIGRGIQQQPSVSLGPEPWFVTKISNSTEFAEFRLTSNREAR